MSLKLGFRNGDCIAPQLSVDLFGGDPEDPVSSDLMDLCREFAFDSDNASDFSHWYLRSEALSKFDDANPESASMREQEAYRKFHEAEASCREANGWVVGWDCYSRFNTAVWRRARGLVRTILGPFPWESFPLMCQFGPGASLALPRRRASQSNKWVHSAHITEAALPYYDAFQRWSSIDLPRELAVVDGNRVTTVPKSFKTDRTIAIEPDWNAFLQRGVGTLIRSRLRRIGKLQPNAQDVHKDLAQVGSALGHLATLDMSMASDSVGIALCEALLPEAWFRVIMDLRSPLGYLAGGEVVDYAKVSSMGNGFTFELETLIFYALTAAVCTKEERYNVSVYGDDIICPAHRAEAVIAILQEAGFSVNEKKSFWDGPFRESCGGHFWKGSDVTPFYLKHHCNSNGDAIVLHNNILDWCSRQPEPVWAPFAATLRAVQKAVPKFLYGPWGIDGCLWSEWDRATPRWSKRFQHYQLKTVKTIKWQSDASHWGSLLQKLWVECPDAETSWGPSGATMETIVSTSCYRDQWDMWPVRRA